MTDKGLEKETMTIGQAVIVKLRDSNLWSGIAIGSIGGLLLLIYFLVNSSLMGLKLVTVEEPIPTFLQNIATTCPPNACCQVLVVPETCEVDGLINKKETI